MKTKRILYENIWERLSAHKQMVFIAGPRQAGKTTFTQILTEDFNNSLYFNWDILDEKRKLIERPFFYEEVHRKDNSVPLIIFDELHKYSNWKNYLKSVYDRDKGNYKFVVSGSGRLDMYQKGGDSLAGRYFIFYLWPFTLAELAGNNLMFEQFLSDPIEVRPPPNETQPIWNKLSQSTGFPDPYLDGTGEFYRIWSNTYRKQLLREDIRDLASIRSIEDVELLFSLLPSKIGSPLSMASLSRDIHVSFDSVRSWIEVFENFFMVFRIAPWTRKVSRAITKEKKLYLFDYAGIDSPAAKFENMVALELFRAVSNWNDLGLGNFSLHYLRNRDKEEVDFLISNNHNPLLLIETKLSDDYASKSLIKFQKILNIPAVQLVNEGDICKLVSNNNLKIMIISAAHWLSLLP
ncbi:MAG: ATP-binding protein [Thermodesulfobacteriota bacterium]|nr:ATP-binding protein [Thermodesulfobacteriota bacterium]